MSNDSETAPPKRSATNRSKPFIVQCVGFRCMAYRDSAGKWRDYFNDDVIEGEVEVISQA